MKNKVSTLACAFATLGPIGYLPCPGTCATIATLPLIYLLSCCLPTLYQGCNVCISDVESYSGLLAIEIGLFLFFLFCLLAVAARVIPFAFERFGNQDSKHIVIDELVGTLITFYGTTLTPFSIIVGVCLFRFFDIVKPLGIKRMETIKSPIGAVLADDILAGFYSMICLMLILKIASWMGY